MTRRHHAIRNLVSALLVTQLAVVARAQTCPESDPCPGNSQTVEEVGFVGPLDPGPGFPDVQVLGFDDSLGELRSVELTVTIAASSQRFRLENLSASQGCAGNPASNAYFQYIDVSIDDPSAASPLCANPSFAMFQGPIPPLPANTEMPPVCNFIGTASLVFNGPMQEQVCSLACIQDHARLQFFKRSIAPMGFVHFAVASTLFSGVSLSCQNFCTAFDGDLKVTITATYTYCTEPGTAYCFGDGLDPVVTAQCPCANFGAAGHGCANSFSGAGGLLTASGFVSPNTIAFSVTEIPNNTFTVGLRSTGNATPQGLVFGDGVRCQSGALVRFGAHNSGTGGDAPNTWASTTTTVAAGVTRYYQVQYRNVAAGFCPPETFNITNGYRLTW